MKTFNKGDVIYYKNPNVELIFIAIDSFDKSIQGIGYRNVRVDRAIKGGYAVGNTFRLDQFDLKYCSLFEEEEVL
jgi:hypothetical protein